MARSGKPRMTLPTLLVLRALMTDPSRELYGLQICAEAGLPSGTVHPILARLEGLGWLSSRWEAVDAREEGRPRRRYYRVDPAAMGLVQAALLRGQASVEGIGRLRPNLAGGTS
ncbi:PadR family transcriptional regulator [Amycolatopsis sp. MJM2582]|uniref:PadR family transcriptional regulator n=1 Tax=Amycolatopsis TaxID=1813 RepID=UPI0005087D1E|nr:helix-turn-helix domain-containing protein [Amycolatopsis sp. MJM2582]KFZ77872.1 PadR family transcriptional regulator [Amycolatopsis sp. MJM2582]